MTDAFTPATRFLVVATVARDRYFDLDAVRTPYRESTLKQHGPDAVARRGGRGSSNGLKSPMARSMAEGALTQAGAPPLDWWLIPDDDELSTPGETMASASYRIGDVFDRLAELPDGSIDLVLTSPPFLALRSYLPADHPDKGREIGSEPTPAAFLDTLLALTAEWRRVLAPHGSIAVELGDTYSGSGGAGGDYADGGMRDGQQVFDGSGRRGRKNTDPYPLGLSGGSSNGKPRKGEGWPIDKSLCILPHLYAACLAYDRNVLTGEPSPAGQWRIRNVVAWVRPNPPVGALGDKYRPATSYMTVATVARDRYFDLDAVRDGPRTSEEPEAPGVKSAAFRDQGVSGFDADRTFHARGGAPALDWWEIPTHPYPGSHYATWPPALCKRPIESMVPQKVCLTCGKPSERITSEPEYVRTDSDRVPARLTMLDGERPAEGVNQHTRDDGANTSVVRTVETLGWSDCGHDNWRRGIVLDPFAGSGTTLAVATGLGRDAIGIDVDIRNAELALDRVGPLFLTVDAPAHEWEWLEQWHVAEAERLEALHAELDADRLLEEEGEPPHPTTDDDELPDDDPWLEEITG